MVQCSYYLKSIRQELRSQELGSQGLGSQEQNWDPTEWDPKDEDLRQRPLSGVIHEPRSVTSDVQAVAIQS